jgi:hypothetical protein
MISVPLRYRDRILMTVGIAFRRLIVLTIFSHPEWWFDARAEGELPFE